MAANNQDKLPFAAAAGGLFLARIFHVVLFFYTAQIYRIIYTYLIAQDERFRVRPFGCRHVRKRRERADDQRLSRL